MTQADRVTQTLARYLVNARADSLPQAVRDQAVRTFLNWLGCAVGASRHEAVDIALAALAPFAGPAQATRARPRANGSTSCMRRCSTASARHVFDFDDTHLKTVIHPAGPVASAILALAEYRPVSGREFLHAFILGVEVECRIGNAVYPEHYDIGWHITGTAGVFGAAAAAGKLLGLDEQQMIWALGIAATQPSGLREMFGTMCKSFHPGPRRAERPDRGAAGARKASPARTAARGASAASPTCMSHAAQLRRDHRRTSARRYEIALNTYKPFACGIVIHPTIDGCIQLRNEHGLKADADRVDRS